MSDADFLKLNNMREGGRILNHAIKRVVAAMAAGISTENLDKIAVETIKELGGEPAFLNYRNYPKSLCVSINDEVVHGIPRKDRVIKNGDVVGLDLGVKYKGFYTDKAVTMGVGKISKQEQKLINVTKQALEMGIEICRKWKNKKISDISGVVQAHVEKNGFSVVRDLSGHGIGKELHEDPRVPNFVSKKFPEVELREGMALAIEPMVAAGDWKVKFLEDGWTVATADGSCAAHFEDTVILTKNGCEILTR